MPHDASTSLNQSKVLILSLDADGGVGTHTGIVRQILAQHGLAADVAYYKPYRNDAALSVPAWKLLHRRPKLHSYQDSDGTVRHEIGVRLPEFESGRYLPTKNWRQVVNGYRWHVCVSGSILAAGPAALLGLPCLAWVGTPFDPDRQERRRTYPFVRRIVDTIIDAPICRLLERQLIRRCRVLANSGYTSRALARIANADRIETLHIPVDPNLSVDGAARRVPKRVAFAGRFSDPRKNFALMLDVLAECLAVDPGFSLHLAGDTLTPMQCQLLANHRARDAVKILGRLDRSDLVGFYQSIDVFLIASFQEGLCLSALEAMRHGVPVVSTRCGGPEDFVIDAVTGYLCSFDAEDLARKILVATDGSHRQQLGERARAHVQANFSYSVIADKFWQVMVDTWPELRSIVSNNP